MSFLTNEQKLELVRAYLGEIHNLPPEAITPEMFDFLKIVSMGAKKYAMNNWLEPNGKKSSEKEMSDSMFHHLAESYTKSKTHVHWEILDAESGLDPLLHLACRALMLYTRRQRNVRHEND